MLNPLIQAIVILVLGGFALWALKGFLQSYFTSRAVVAYDKLVELEAKVNLHVSTCEEVPKSLILEKIENLAKEMRANNVDAKEFREEMKEEIKLQRSRYDQLGQVLQNIMLKS